LKTKATISFQVFVTMYKTAWCHNPKDRNSLFLCHRNLQICRLFQSNSNTSLVTTACFPPDAVVITFIFSL
jgi:hypothetical protein